jgi:hypothetical protein
VSTKKKRGTEMKKGFAAYVTSGNKRERREADVGTISLLSTSPRPDGEDLP